MPMTYLKMDAFIPKPGSISNCNNTTEYECTRKHLNGSDASNDVITTLVSSPLYSNNLTMKQYIRNDSLHSEESKMFVIQNPHSKTAYLIQSPVESHSRAIDTSSTVDQCSVSTSYDALNCSFNSYGPNCLLSPSSPHSAACQQVEQYSSSPRKSFEVKEHIVFNSSANKSPVFKQRLRRDITMACKMKFSEGLSHDDDSNDKSNLEFSKFRRDGIVTPRPSIHANQNEPSTSRHNFIEPNHRVFSSIRQRQFHSGSSPLQSCPTNNMHIKHSVQNKQSYQLQTHPQWHILKHRQQNLASENQTSLVFSYESPNVEQLPICSSPSNNVFVPSMHQQTNEMQNADHFSAHQESVLSQQMTPEHNTFLNSRQEGNPWPHQLNQTHMIHNSLTVSSQAVTSPYFNNSGTFTHQHCRDVSSMTCQSKPLMSPVKFPAEELTGSINFSNQEIQPNISNFQTPLQLPNTSHVELTNFHATKMSNLPQSNQALPICQSESQLVAEGNLNKSLPTCQMKFGAISKAEKDKHVLASEEENKKVIIHCKNFNVIKDPSEDEPGRANGSKISTGIQSKDDLKIATLDTSNQSNKSKICNTLGQERSISSKEKTENELVSISAASRINPQSSITSIKAKSKVIIKSLESSNFKNGVASKQETSTVITKPIGSVATSRLAGVRKIYIKQNQQSSFIQPTKPIKPSLDRRKPSLEVIELKDNGVKLKTDTKLSFCDNCGVVQEYKYPSLCIQCGNPLLKQAKVINPCKDTAIDSKRNTEAHSSNSESLDEKEDIIVKLSKEQTEELNNLNISYNNKDSDKISHSMREESGKVNTSDDPEIFILSSDDEEQYHRRCQILNSEPQEIKSLEQNRDSPKNLEQNSYLSGGGLTFDEEWENESKFESASATSIHIGNFEVYKYKDDELNKKAPERVYFRKGQIQFEVATVIKENEAEAVWLKINEDEIETIICHFGSSFPGSIMMVLMKSEPAEQIKKKLGMTEEKNFNFDPLSSDPAVRYVILKLQCEKLKELVIDAILGCFNVTLIRCVDKETMNNLLREALSEGKECGYPSQTLLIYPPPPCRGGITITTKDYYCLEEGQFLNDVILDFYLKYLVLEELSKEDKERTHLFSTFFYKRLTSKPKGKNTFENNNAMSSAEIRHARVKSWTKDVDIFEKDFIIIPINERSHWFLAIICFPGLVSSNPAGIAASANIDKRNFSSNNSKVKIPIVEDIEWSDKDEAESEDEDCVPETQEEPDAETLEIRQKFQCTKQPCILIFDSLAGASRSRIVATLRDYLTVEYFEKKKIHKIFSKDLIKGAYLNVPQQTNYTDCGIFTLQFVESFFQNPLKSFQFPIPSLRNWFAQERVSCKRKYIARKIENLMNKFKPNNGIKLMKIIFKSAEEDDKKYTNAKTKLSEKTQNVTEVKSIKSKVSNEVGSAKPKNLQISKVDTSKEIIVEDFKPVALTSTIPRIPKRPLTPGPYRKPDPKYQTPLAGLYGDKNSVLQRNIDSKSISVANVSHTSIFNNNKKFKFEPTSSNFLKPNSLKSDKSFCKATSSSLEGGGTKLKSEEDDVIFDTEILKPKLGESLNFQKQIAKTLNKVESPFKALSTKTTVISSCQGNQDQEVKKNSSFYDFHKYER